MEAFDTIELERNPEPYTPFNKEIINDFHKTLEDEINSFENI